MKKTIIIGLCIITLLSSMVFANEYYFSSSTGSDASSTCNVTAPCQTLTKLNTLELTSGDTIYFKKGDVWHVGNDDNIEVASGDSTFGYVTYTSYGTGNKPMIMGGFNASSTGNWTENSSNIWEFAETSSTELGMVFMNYTGNTLAGYIRSSESQLITQGYFYYNITTDKLRMYSVSNPATYYGPIEVGYEDTIMDINGADHFIIDGLDLRYGSKHGIDGSGATNAIIRNNDVSFIGGGYQSGTTRWGNCIQFYHDSINITVNDNNISYCYDAGITPQSSDCGYNMINHNYTRNIITNTHYSIEIFNEITGCDDIQGIMENISITHNTLINSGIDAYRTSSGSGIGIRFGTATDNTSNITFRDNIYYGSTGSEINLEGSIDHNNWNGEYPNFDYGLYYNTTRTLWIRWENVNYTGLNDFYSGEGMEEHGIQSDPLFVEGTYQPYNNSFACGAASDGGDIGAVPCGGTAYVEPGVGAGFIIVFVVR